MFGNGPLRRGRTPIKGAQSSTVAWRISIPVNGGGAAIGLDGTVYQGTELGQLLALDGDGATKWAVPVRYRVNSTPAILPDSRIAFVDEGGTVYVVNSDGSRSWRYSTGTIFPAEASPAVGVDGTLYTGIDQTVYAFHPDGSIRWTYDAGEGITGPVAVRPDGVVYVPASDLVALDPDGTLLWRWTSPAPKGVAGAPAIGYDGTIYLNSMSPDVFAVNPDGTTRWSYHVANCCDDDGPSSPAIARDGTIYLGESVAPPGHGLEGVLLALSASGSLEWRVHIGSGPTAPTIGGDGTIYVGGTSVAAPGSVWAINPDGTSKWTYDDPDGGYVRSAPAIGLGRRVYAGSQSAFFAIGP